MARKLRIEAEGAMYHVVNRGNYRRDVFESEGAAQAFVTVLEQASESYAWIVHAYVVMRNHYHLVLETPKPNLVEGMHWLQTTIATKFNRYRGERGHLFQGRYHAGLIQDEGMLAHVVNYVHLNPARAGIIPVEESSKFRWSSLGRFVRDVRFRGLEAARWLAQLGLHDSKQGWQGYQQYIEELFMNLEEQKRLGWDGFSCGWALGTEAWKTQMAKEHARKKLLPSLDAATNKELKERLWMELLKAEFESRGHSASELATCRRGEPWKVQLALHLRKQHGIPVVWLAKQLFLGTPDAARSLLSHAKGL